MRPVADGVDVVPRRLLGRRPRSVRIQLLMPILVATAGLGALGTVQTMTSAAAAADAGLARNLAGSTVAALNLAAEVDQEFAETASFRLRGGQDGMGLVTAQRVRTDVAVQRYRVSADRAVRAVPALSVPVQQAQDDLNSLSDTRLTAVRPEAGYVAAADQAYLSLANALLAVAQVMPDQIVQGGLSSEARAAAAAATIAHTDAVERVRLLPMFQRRSPTAEDLAWVAMTAGRRQEQVSEFMRVADQPARTVYNELVRGLDVDAAVRVRDRLLVEGGSIQQLDMDADGWFVASSNAIRRTNLVGLQLADRLEVDADHRSVGATRRAWGIGLGTGALALAALITSVALVIQLSRRLRELQAAALAVAHQELPAAIAAVDAGTASTEPGLGESAEVTRRLGLADDEIGALARAFATVQRTALTVAGQQAELRVDVSKMVEILARRIRSLITRQLMLLDEFERNETDPDVLERLFALDHLAARMRRNGENLLVLAGGAPAQPYREEFALVAVVRAAASEIEDYTRVIMEPTDVMIAGVVVRDLVHLLAELLENAATFSPPNATVRVDARVTVDGVDIRIHDNGIGMAPARIEEINARLAQPATLTSVTAWTMGLHVVSHLAARCDIRVRLSATGPGTLACVSLPHSAVAERAFVPLTAALGRVCTPGTVTLPTSDRALLRPDLLTAGSRAAPASDVVPVVPGVPVVSGVPGGGGGPGAPADRSPATSRPLEALPRRQPSGQAGSLTPVSLQRPAATVPSDGLPADLLPADAVSADVPSDVVPLEAEAVRRRLSAFAEGVSAARRGEGRPR